MLHSRRSLMHHESLRDRASLMRISWWRRLLPEVRCAPLLGASTVYHHLGTAIFTVTWRLRLIRQFRRCEASFPLKTSLPFRGGQDGREAVGKPTLTLTLGKPSSSRRLRKLGPIPRSCATPLDTVSGSPKRVPRHGCSTRRLFLVESSGLIFQRTKQPSTSA